MRAALALDTWQPQDQSQADRRPGAALTSALFSGSGGQAVWGRPAAVAGLVWATGADCPQAEPRRPRCPARVKHRHGLKQAPTRQLCAEHCTLTVIHQPHHDVCDETPDHMLRITTIHLLLLYVSLKSISYLIIVGGA